MKRLTLAVLAATTSFVVAEPVEAQRWSFDWGLYGGGSFYTASLDDAHLGEGTEDVKHKAGWLAGTQATLWFGNIGLRPNASYAERPLEQGGENLAEDINLWDLSLDLLFRFKSPAETWAGSEFLPYLALGGGVKFTDPAVDVGFDDEEGVPFFASGSTFMYNDQAQPMGRVALGGDVRFRPNMALRLEIGDKLWDSPVFRTGPGNTLAEGDEDVGNVVNEIYGQIGLQFLFGLKEPEVVVVAPPPPPPARPEPPAPPPPPAERNIMVCVIDPASGAMGLREVSAIYIPSQGDTLVEVSGQRRPLRATLPTGVRLARSADWYVAGQPMVLQVRRNRAEFVTYGGARVIDPDNLAFIGYVNGLPVYAAEDDVSDIQDQLDDLRDADDIEDVLEQNRELEREFEEIEVLYVPLEATGCVFQGLQRVEQVRKAR